MQTFKVNLLNKLRQIVSSATEQDTIMLFAAGHGFRSAASGRFFLATRQTRLDDLDRTSIAWKDIAAAFERSRARVVVLLDACHAGSVAGANDDAVSALLNRGGPITVVAATKGRQLSLEYDDGGAFATALVNAITTKRDQTDANANGAVELSELYGVVKRSVLSMTRGEQTPWIARNEMIGEIPLF